MAHYRATRTESFTRGEVTYHLVAGNIYTDLPDDLVEAIGGEYGGLEEVEEGTTEVQAEDGSWTEEAPADG